MQRAEWPEAIRELEKLQAENPGSAAIGEALEEARLRAQFDANTKVKPKRFAYPWQRVAVRAALVVVIIFGLWQVSTMVVRATVPMLNASRQAAELAALQASAQEYLEGGDWDNAGAAIPTDPGTARPAARGTHTGGGGTGPDRRRA